jgi:hypothetical protein
MLENTLLKIEPTFLGQLIKSDKVVNHFFTVSSLLIFFVETH